MPTQLSKLPDLPVILREIDADYGGLGQLDKMTEENIALLDVQTEPTYFVILLHNLKFSFEDMIQGVNSATKQTRFLKHPQLAELVLITTQKPLELMAKGLASPVFGRLAVKTVPNLDVALDYVRQQITNK
jgi:hypothetical protein